MTNFDNSLPMIVYRTLDAIMPNFRELFSQYELTEQQWRVLRVLWNSGRVTSVQLAQNTLLPAPSLVGIVDRLEKKGLVVRLRSDQDRRVVFVSATPIGKALGKEVAPYVDEINEKIQSAVSEREWKSMQRTLEKISAHMSQVEMKNASNG
jgi:homoprotocatechuate degradation regulator HpaR